MTSFCICGDCMNDLMLGSGFYLIKGEEGYIFHTIYDIDDDDMEFYLNLVKATIKSGYEVGGNRWINGYDAFERIDFAVLNRAGIDPRNPEIDDHALAGLFAIARSSFLSALVKSKLDS